MRPTALIIGLLLLMLISVAPAVPNVSAAEQATTVMPAAWGQPPVVPKGKGDKCVADTDFMRRYHMQMLDHQRDDTVIDGIRTAQFSLKGCISCHAVRDAKTKSFVTIKDKRHFCRVCHDYAAVKMDCFDCHASRPGTDAKSKAAITGGPAIAALRNYLGGKRQ